MYQLSTKRSKRLQTSPVWLVVAAIAIISLYMMIFEYSLIVGGY